MQNNTTTKRLNKMKSKLRILAMFTVLFAMLFVPDLNKELFDWKCQGSGKLIVVADSPDYYEKCNYSNSGYHLPSWHWGYGHDLLIVAGLTFIVWTVVEEINKSQK